MLEQRTIHIHDMAAEIETEYPRVKEPQQQHWQSNNARHAAAARRRTYRRD